MSAAGAGAFFFVPSGLGDETGGLALDGTFGPLPGAQPGHPGRASAGPVQAALLGALAGAFFLLLLACGLAGGLDEDGVGGEGGAFFLLLLACGSALGVVEGAGDGDELRELGLVEAAVVMEPRGLIFSFFLLLVPPAAVDIAASVAFV